MRAPHALRTSRSDRLSGFRIQNLLLEIGELTAHHLATCTWLKRLGPRPKPEAHGIFAELLNVLLMAKWQDMAGGEALHDHT